jgi:HD-GYP domain-containing protein (c-di-GMP phosphodiesterase class II)
MKESDLVNRGSSPLKPIARSAAPHGPIEVRAQLARLREAAERAAPRDIDLVSHELASAVDGLLTEQAGMAEELLCVYEQLGIVFEISRKFAGVSDEHEVIGLFLDSLRLSFQGCEVFAARPRARGGWKAEGTILSLDDWTVRQLNRAREEESVVVATPARADASPAGLKEWMVAPVFAGETFVGTIVLARRAEGRAFRASDMSLLHSLSIFCGDLIRNHRLVRELRNASIAMVRSLVNAVEQKDEYTSGHSLRVAYYALLLGRALSLSEVDLQMLHWSALLHDVGKIGIRDDVLKKPGRLTDEEFRHIKEHPVRSYKIVHEVPQLARALDGVLYHHEHYDGTGYPDGLAGEAIPLQARVIQIADVFDALTTSRSYRPAYDWQRALQIMAREAGRTIDPRLQTLFDGLIRARLADGEGAWERLTRQAERFGPDVEEPNESSKESPS